VQLGLPPKRFQPWKTLPSGALATNEEQERAVAVLLI
jgi:hypothetical protein